MRNMNENGSIKEKIAGIVGGMLEKHGQDSTDRCILFTAYEPKIPMELLKEDSK